MHHALHTRFCELAGVERPIVQTGMGWVSGRPSDRGDERGRRARDPRRGHDDRRRSSSDAVREVKARTDKPFGVNFRADQPDLARAHRVRRSAKACGVVSFAGAPTKDAIARLHDAGVLVHADRRRPPARREDARVGRRRGDRPGRRGRRPHRHRADVAAAAAGRRRGRRRRSPCSAPAASTTAAASSPRWPTAPTASPWARASCSRRRAACPTRSRQRYLDGVGHRHGGHDRARRRAAARDPHRHGRPHRAGRRVVTRFPRALRAALRFRKDTGTSLRDLVREGLAMRKQPGPDVEPGGAGRERADADQGGDGRRRPDGRRPADRPGHRRRSTSCRRWPS